MSIDFGLVTTGVTVQATMVVSNAGAADLDGSAGIMPGPFGIDSGTPFHLQASDSTNLVISFAPIVSGVFSNVVVITSSGGDSTNSLTGRASAPQAIFGAMRTGTDFAFWFTTVPGLTYDIQYKDSLDDPMWQTLQSVSGDGTVKTIVVSVSAPHRFYRLSVH